MARSRPAVAVQAGRHHGQATSSPSAPTRLPVTGSWGPAPECDRADILFASVFYIARHTRTSAASSTNVVNGRDDGASSAWIAALDLAAQNGWQRCRRQWLMAGFRIADRHDMLDLLSPSTPEFAGFARDSGGWAASAWSPGARPPATRSASRRAEHLYTLGDGEQPCHPASRCGHGQTATSPSRCRPSRTRERKARSNATAAPEKQEMKAAVWKTATYRVVGSTTTFLVALPFTGGVLIDAGLLTLVNAVSHSALYFLHELAWDRVRHGQAAPRPRARRGRNLAMRAVRLAVALLAVLTGPVAGRDSRTADPGDFRDRRQKRYPLPEGDWQVVARRVTPAAESPAKVAISGAVLVQRSSDRVVAAITVHTNR